MLRADGLGALVIERLWWVLFILSSIVLAAVMGMALFAVARRNHPMKDPHHEPTWATPFLVISGIVIPVILLTGTFVYSLHDMQQLAAQPGKAKLTITVTGHQWWWEARYPGGVVTANEIHIPTGETVRVLLTTADVIHSFWVPQLQSKTDMIPGRTNESWLQTDKPGRYRGECLQYCGLQHANMIFYVIAEPPAAFQAWLAGQAAPAAAPSTPEEALGLQTFLTETCTGCHTIRGTPAVGNVGPDLTHVASRQTIGSGVIANTPQNLATWITDVQNVKPGAEMPDNYLTPAQVNALVAYLDSLR
jgi:cytochrome c oxidase subunit 2